ncbi:MAG: substrate-binding domain-containing protein, partial [Bifidobacteriaceae bacterium]|nr:substrate-binding domain-containing protein [Bifidobacteriaceae bacterium]
MKPVKSKKAAVVLAGVLVASLAACAQNENSTDPTANPSGNTNKLSGTIDGAGASSQTAAQEAWRAGFASLQPDVIVNYDPQGSGVGREQFAAGGIAFAGSDRAFKVDEITAGLQACSANSGVVEVPVYIGPIVVAFNLDEADSLNLAPTVIADIFTGKITKWNDPAIAADNPGV